MTDKDRDWKSIRHALYEAIGGFAACLAVTLTLFFEVVVLRGTCGEDSFVEASQVSMLFLSSVVFLKTALRHRDIAGGMVLIGGFLMCMAIRELDWVTDRLAHGSWVFFALAAAAFFIRLAVKNKETLVHGLAVFARSRACPFMMTGLLCVLVFSRLFGSKYIWYTLYDVERVRILKNVVEEGLEMFGMALILTSSIMQLAAEGLSESRD
ncbi:MAG: hypothetical protein GX615_13725 [Lentisphaerae bacterium]|nr:hypothetical protein [Lentisphaerota bacterium]